MHCTIIKQNSLFLNPIYFAFVRKQRLSQAPGGLAFCILIATIYLISTQFQGFTPQRSVPQGTMDK